MDELTDQYMGCRSTEGHPSACTQDKIIRFLAPYVGPSGHIRIEAHELRKADLVSMVMTTLPDGAVEIRWTSLGS